MNHPTLFDPIQVGAPRLPNRIIMAPLTRSRAGAERIPNALILYSEAADRRRMMSISTHDRISGIPGRVKVVEEFIKYAQKQKGVAFMRKDEIAMWALAAPNVPHEA